MNSLFSVKQLEVVVAYLKSQGVEEFSVEYKGEYSELKFYLWGCNENTILAFGTARDHKIWVTKTKNIESLKLL